MALGKGAGRFLVLVLAFFILAAPVETARAQTLSPLFIETETGTHEFAVEIAATPAQRATGLMHRRSMPQENGMLFDFGRSQAVGMWMENTHIPLDMIFITEGGRVASIAENTVPFSRDVIDSGGPVRYVLEVNAGIAERLRLKPGDTVRHAIIGGG